MNVILLEKIGKLGEIGDTASVKAGYARNFLFPLGKAIPATKANLEDLEQRRSDLLAIHNEKMSFAQARADKVKNTQVKIEVNASDEGKLFGSVGTRDIANALNARNGSDIQKSEVLMPHGVIRQLGDYQIQLDLGYDVNAEISLSVVGLRSVAGIDADGSIIDEIDETETAESAEPKATEAEASAKSTESGSEVVGKGA